MGCTDSKPVAKPAKASKTAKAPKKAPVAAPVPTEPVHPGPVATEPEPVQAAEPAEAAEAAEPESTELPAEAPVTDDGEGQTSAGAAAVAAVDLELEAELPVIPEGSLGMKAEGLEESETTAEPKDEESPRLFGRLKVEAAPDVARGPCVCTNFW
ncbi:CLPC1 [Symbiodinium natans]|uniref:CLPC1 protein n=1 Tax=Symbiodinium natans TaxID=878477 RepID=A0A812PFJ2_9DINO|nr:CLPC1 [Symbiodinium natans]